MLEEELKWYLEELTEREKSPATIAKYSHDVKLFLGWKGQASVTKQLVIAYEQWLVERYAPASVNSMLAALNNFLEFTGRHECRVRALKIQRALFRPEEKELSREEYLRLLGVARQKSVVLWLAMQTLCGAGLRVSELRFVTVESLQSGRVQVNCKGKRRVALLPRALVQKLKKYAARHRIHAGPVLVTSRGKPLDRSHIWAEMKKLCGQAGVARQKVFPHNLRHLFARTYYRASKDLLRLADLLGHSSVNTTRIYTLSDGRKECRQIEGLRLIQ